MRVALLLEHFSELGDDREPWRVMYPLKEVLLLVVCATIASCDDFYDIVAWGEHHLDFLRRFAAFHHGIPCKRWVRMLVNRVDPVLFARCFGSWVEALWPGRHDLIAIDGKTARRTHDQRKGLKALHTLSAYASSARLVLAQLSVPEKTNEITAIPDLLDELAEAKQLKGALVTIDAMGCQVEIANKIIAHQADYLLALKGNQLPISSSPKPPLRRGMVVSRPASTPPRRRSTGSCPNVAIQPSHASPTSRHSSRSVAAPSRAEHADRGTFDIRYFICSAPLDIDRLANGIRGHWGIESMHWLLDVEFKDDLSRYRTGHGAKNMAVVRRFALSLVRANKAKGSVKTRRKCAGWDPKFLLEILQLK